MQAPGPNSQWYVGRDGQQYGPMPTTQLQGDYRAGVLLPTDYLWCAEVDRWILASEIFGPASRPPPPPPSAPVAPQQPQQLHSQQLQSQPTFQPAAAASPTAADRAAHHDNVTHTIVEGGSFKFSTFIWIVAGLCIPFTWPVTLPLCWYMAYRSYKAPSSQTVRVITERR